MATATRTEYISIDGLPLTTAAWETEDIASILDGPATRGNDLTIPTRYGALARRRVFEPREITIPLTVNGWYDSDGGTHADPRAGLLANLDELKKHLAPDYTSLEGTRRLLWEDASGDIYREADVHVSPAIQVASLGPNAARVVITAVIPGGVLRSAYGPRATYEAIASGVTSTTFTVTQGTSNSTGEIQDAVIVFGGEATWPFNALDFVDSGAPDSGIGTTGDWYYDEDAAQVYGPKGAGGDWPGPFDVQFVSGSAPSVNNISREAYTIRFDAGVATSVYGPRTIGNPNAVRLKIENLSYDSTGAVYIDYNQAITGLLTIDCGEYSAVEGATTTSGTVITGGTPLWLPLLPGSNTLRATLTSNSADASLNIVANQVFL